MGLQRLFVQCKFDLCSAVQLPDHNSNYLLQFLFVTYSQWHHLHSLVHDELHLLQRLVCPLQQWDTVDTTWHMQSQLYGAFHSTYSQCQLWDMHDKLPIRQRLQHCVWFDIVSVIWLVVGHLLHRGCMDSTHRSMHPEPMRPPSGLVVDSVF